MKIAGLPVVDATKPLKLKITPRDVKSGDTKDPGGCAAARAIMRQQHCSQARVHLGRTYVKDDKKQQWVRYRTPTAIRAEIVSFDRGARFADGNYVIPPMQPSHLARGERRKIAKPGTGHGKVNPRKNRKKYHAVAGVRAKGANR